MSLGKIKAFNAESLAEQAWETGHEYQRIAALWVFKDVGSNKLLMYLQKAEEDGRIYVVQNAREIQSSI